MPSKNVMVPLQFYNLAFRGHAAYMQTTARVVWLTSVHEVTLDSISGEQVNTFLEVFSQHTPMATYATVEANHEDYR